MDDDEMLIHETGGEGRPLLRLAIKGMSYFVQRAIGRALVTELDKAVQGAVYEAFACPEVKAALRAAIIEPIAKVGVQTVQDAERNAR